MRERACGQKKYLEMHSVLASHQSKEPVPDICLFLLFSLVVLTPGNLIQLHLANHWRVSALPTGNHLEHPQTLN
jgi:hypothetical protein